MFGPDVRNVGRGNTIIIIIIIKAALVLSMIEIVTPCENVFAAGWWEWWVGVGETKNKRVLGYVPSEAENVKTPTGLKLRWKTSPTSTSSWPF